MTRQNKILPYTGCEKFIKYISYKVRLITAPKMKVDAVKIINIPDEIQSSLAIYTSYKLKFKNHVFF